MQPGLGTAPRHRGVSYAKWGYLFIAPFFIAFAVFQLIPLFSTVYYSFFEHYRSGLKIIGPNFVAWRTMRACFRRICPSTLETRCSCG